MSPVIARLNALSPLSSSLIEQIEGLGRRMETVAAGATLVEAGEAQQRPRYIVDGWACRLRMLPDGRRQLFSLLVPGDGLGISARAHPLAQSHAVALTRLTTVDASVLVDSPSDEFRRLMARTAAQNEDMLLGHIVRLGRQTAYERTAHLLVEIGQRLRASGVGEANVYHFPVTQEALADLLGLSIVHVNRTLQQLRRDGLIDMVRGEMHLLNLDTLMSLSDFPPPRSAPQA
jgi:CRP-like cAMP-binding protein